MKLEPGQPVGGEALVYGLPPRPPSFSPKAVVFLASRAGGASQWSVVSESCRLLSLPGPRL